MGIFDIFRKKEENPEPPRLRHGFPKEKPVVEPIDIGLERADESREFGQPTVFGENSSLGREVPAANPEKERRMAWIRSFTENTATSIGNVLNGQDSDPELKRMVENRMFSAADVLSHTKIYGEEQIKAKVLAEGRSIYIQSKAERDRQILEDQRRRNQRRAA